MPASSTQRTCRGPQRGGDGTMEKEGNTSSESQRSSGSHPKRDEWKLWETLVFVSPGCFVSFPLNCLSLSERQLGAACQ